MKKLFTYLFGLLSGVTICLLFYEYGFDYISKHFEQVIAIYIVGGLIGILALVLIYVKSEKFISKLEKENKESETLNISEAINKKDWKALDSIANKLQTDVKQFIAKWGVANWVFRTFQIIILGFVGLFGSMLVYNQNILFEHQNHRLDQQTYLQEAERRSSLIFLFSNVLDKVDEELKEEGNENRELSNQLIGRIISLSEAFKPYKYLENDSLINIELSPERGQLLLALVNSNISPKSFSKIVAKANLAYADLRGVDLNNVDLTSGRLEGANFSNASLIDANLSNANLKNASFYDSNCRLINFTTAYLYGTDLRKTNLNVADLRYTFQDGIPEGPQMDTDITNSKVDRKDWIEFHKRYMVKGMSEIEKYFYVDTTKLYDKSGIPYYLIKNNLDYY